MAFFTTLFDHDLTKLMMGNGQQELWFLLRLALLVFSHSMIYVLLMSWAPICTASWELGERNSLIQFVSYQIMRAWEIEGVLYANLC